MKTILKITALVICAVLMLSSLVACSSGVKTTDDLVKVKENGVLKVGMECAYAPFNWTQLDDSNGAVKIANADGYANGYDVQIAKKIADGLDVTLEIYQYEWDALIPAVDAGTLDCIIAGMSPTDERKETISFSSNYYVSNLVIIVNQDSEYANAVSLSDFKGASVGAQDGTFHAAALSQIEDVKSSIMKDFTILYTAVTSGTIDGYIAEEPTAFAITAANESLTFAKLVNNDTGFTCDEGDTAIAVGLRKNSTLNTLISETINNISLEERSSLMQNMVALAPTEE